MTDGRKHVIALVMALSFGSVTTLEVSAQTATEDLSAAIPDEVTLVYTGAETIMLLAGNAGEDLQPTGVELATDEGIPLSNLNPGDRVAAVPASQPDSAPYFIVEAGRDALGATVEIPDPRTATAVEVTVANSLDRKAVVSRQDPNAVDDELTEIVALDAGTKASFGANPQEQLVINTVDGAFIVNATVSFESRQTIDLSQLVEPEGERVDVEIVNLSTRPVAVEEVLEDSLMRIAVIEAGKEVTVSAVVGSELDLVTSDLLAKRLPPYLVTDAADQAIIIDHNEETTAASLSPQTDLSILPPADAEAALSFLSNFKDRSEVAGFIAYNSGDQPATYFLRRPDETAIGYRTVQPGQYMRVMTRVGNDVVLAEGEVTPETLNLGAIVSITDVTPDMNQVLDIGIPEKRTVTLENKACKPASIFTIDAFGEPVLLHSMGPLADPVQSTLYAGSTLYAVAGDGSAIAGQRFWNTTIDADSDTLELRYDAGAGQDRLLRSVFDDADASFRTILMRNDSSRPLQIFEVDESGSPTSPDNGVIAVNETAELRYRPGQLLVLQRPNSPSHIAVYGRYRVTDAPNQSFEISSLRREKGVIGSWIDTPRFAVASDQNGVGATNFITFVEGEGNTVQGSMSHGDGLDGVPAYFEGCADEVDAYGKWGSQYGQKFVCGENGSTWEGSNGVAYRGYGTFEAHLSGDGRLSFSRGWCGGDHAAAETWYRLPRHFADMDPSTSPFRTGDFDGSSWAPKNFGWLGRGYDLLYTDPLDFGSAEDGIVSADPLFSFFFEDADGHASQTENKQIFGVSVLPNGKIDCRDESTLIKTFADLREFSSKSYSGNIGVPGIASFSLSKSHSEMNNAATGRDHMYVLHWCDAKNRTDTAKLRWSKGMDYLRQHLDPSFRQAIEQISIRDSNAEELQAILDRYGTHFSERVVYGGRFYEKTQVDKYTYQAASEEKDGLSVQAEGTVKKVSIGGGYQSEDGTSEANQNAIEGTHTEKKAVGGKDVSAYSEWVKTVPENPMPVDVRFRPIHELLSPVFFPDDPEIGVKQHLLKQATLAYFRKHNVQDLSSDPAMLHRTPPRHICVRMEALTIERKDESPGDYYGGRLEAGFADRLGNPVGEHTVEVAFMDGYEAEDGTTWSTGSFTEGGKFPFDRIPTYGGFNDCSEYIGEGKGESYIRDGYLYLFGHIQVNDGKGASLPQAFPTGEHKFSLRDVGSSEPHYFSGEIPFEGNTARYRLKVWEWGAQPGEGE